MNALLAQHHTLPWLDTILNVVGMLLLLAVALTFAGVIGLTVKYAIRDARRQEMAHRIARGLCVRCGYNLTGNAGNVCPECGTQVKLA